ncbi:MAG: hypothetical protein AB7J28_08490 [Hyphomonadaceae bacterium]
MNRRTLLAFVLPLALIACASAHAGHEANAERFEGVWDFHFETSSFRTTDRQGPYWLSGDGEVWPQLTAPFGATGHPWGTLDVVVEGELSAPGQYGHLGAYERELRVTRVISSRLHEESGS